MTICPKCGGGSISGPHYERTPWGSEHLRYKCVCGYSTTEPTRDADKDSEPPLGKQKVIK